MRHPGDLIILGPGTYPELVVMWKPVRLQGVGAASTIINAAKFPTEKLAQWRPRINCAFGLDRKGNAATPSSTCPAQTALIRRILCLVRKSLVAWCCWNPLCLVLKREPVSRYSPRTCRKTLAAATHRGSKSNFLCAPSRIDGIGSPAATRGRDLRQRLGP